MADALFISDLHLSRERPAVTALFLRFLEEQSGSADNLYILGDLFDAWIGDDDNTPPSSDVREALKATSSRGTAVHLMHGNRDFLIGDRFAVQAGCLLLPDPTLIHLHHEQTLLMHGDLLCSDDLEYQQARKFLRSSDFINDFLSKTIEERIVLAAEYRKRSGEVISLKPADIMDVNQQSVQQAMSEHRATLLIHGHTHRPGSHHFALGGDEVRRIVLGDWSKEHGHYLRAGVDGLSSHLITP
ncbi:MAG: UDP-2,3-diacylglucosamine diphosphatase [Candidatus Sedimenticola sp. (ex Thyasira tokunagai)]